MTREERVLVDVQLGDRGIGVVAVAAIARALDTLPGEASILYGADVPAGVMRVQLDLDLDELDRLACEEADRERDEASR